MAEFSPYKVKKDKNFSKELHCILNSNIKQRGVPGKTNEKSLKSVATSHLDQMLEFIWTKIEEKFSSFSIAFRYFDQENNTTVNKQEFRDGLQRLKVRLSNEDFNSAFSYLDKHRIGYFTYNQFCTLSEEKRRYGDV